MKIYIASSWKNNVACLQMAKLLRQDGHEVDCFCDTGSNRFCFTWEELNKSGLDIENTDYVDALKNHVVKNAFIEDRTYINWCEILLMLLPCGASSHLEAGYAKGIGKRVFIYGNLPKGKFETMYGFADGIFREGELSKLRAILRTPGIEKCVSLIDQEIERLYESMWHRLSQFFGEVDNEEYLELMDEIHRATVSEAQSINIIHQEEKNG